MSTQTKKTTVGIAIAAVGAAVIALGVGTFAFFSSTGNANTTTAAAGTLQIGESTNSAITLATFVPGGAPQQRTLTYTNDGTLSGNLSLAFVLTDKLENGCNGDETSQDATCGASGDLGELQDKLTVTVTGGDTPYNGLLSGIPSISTAGVAPGASVTYTFTFSFPNGGAADNAAQGDGVTLQTTATLQQP